MAYIIAAPCVDVKDRSCVEVCPVDCIYEADVDQGVLGPPDGSVGPGMKDQVVLRKDGGRHSIAQEFMTDPGKKDQARRQLFIHPEECIDCGACEPECPVEAIFAEEEVPEEWKEFIKLNTEVFGK
ncbi:MAG: 4Fe-4S binding protein [bacterium]|nr:4Fe-4S binding protein [bacterium]